MFDILKNIEILVFMVTLQQQMWLVELIFKVTLLWKGKEKISEVHFYLDGGGLVSTCVWLLQPRGL